MVEYLNAYKETPPGRGRDVLFENFSYYQIACSTKKMYRRIVHSLSVSFVDMLEAVTQEKVRHSYEAFGDKVDAKHLGRSKDLALGTLLTKIKERGVAELLKDVNQPDMSQFNSLLAFVEGPEARNTVYDVDICLDFHRFLITVLLGYRRALIKFCEDVGEKGGADPKKGMEFDIEGAPESCQDRALTVWRFTHLLWRIAYSRLLRFHLSILGTDGHISIPIYGSVETEDEEAAEIRLQDNPQTLAYLVCLGWIRLQVVPLASLNAMSVFSANSPNPIDISLVAIRKPRTSAVSLEPWETTVSKLYEQPCTMAQSPADSQVVDARAAIELIKAEMASTAADPAADWRVKNACLVLSGNNFRATPHCESSMATLMSLCAANSASPGGVPPNVKTVIEVSSAQPVKFLYVDVLCEDVGSKIHRHVQGHMSHLFGSPLFSGGQQHRFSDTWPP